MPAQRLSLLVSLLGVAALACGSTDTDPLGSAGAAGAGGAGGGDGDGAYTHYCNGPESPTGTTLYVDGAQGSDDGVGSAADPYRTVRRAIVEMQSGDALVIAGGIYRLDEWFRFEPAGKGRGGETVFRAAAGERVIFTSPSSAPPHGVTLADYVRLERLWFGGQRQPPLGDTCAHEFSDTGAGFLPGNGPDPVGHGKAIVGCTFFGYDGIVIGSQEDVLFQGNRHVLTGRNCYSHAIYLSGGADNPDGCTQGQVSNHMIVDRSIFVANEGYAAHGYHIPFSGIVTRNVFAGNFWGLVWDGSDALVANNLFWKHTGFSDRGPIGALLYGGHQRVTFMNNVFGPASPLVGDVVSTDRVTHNAYLETDPRGEHPLTLASGQETESLGVAAAELDGAVAVLRDAFAGPVEEVLVNVDIEPAFAMLRATLPVDSPLYGAGLGWLDANPVNVGPDAPGPACQESFWEGYRAQGLRDIDRFCQLPDGSPY